MLKYGPAFPFGNSVRSVLDGKTRREAIKTSLRLILTTPKGSVIYDPQFGSQIPALVFSIIDETLVSLVLYYALSEIEEQEKRVKILSANVQREARKITIILKYKDKDSEIPDTTSVLFRDENQ